MPARSGDALTQSRVAVLMPARNAAAHIWSALELILVQRHAAALEVIVVDDGSTDATAEIVHEVRRANPEVRLVAGPARGIPFARNAAVAAMAPSAAFVTFLDADDLSPPDRIARDLATLRDDPDLDLVWGMTQPFQSGTELERSSAPSQGRERRSQLAGLLLRRTFFDRIGGFNETLPMGEDVDFVLRMLELGPETPPERCHRGVLSTTPCQHHPRCRARSTDTCARVPARRAAPAQGWPDDSRWHLSYRHHQPGRHVSSYDVVIPAYMSAPFIGATIELILRQTVPPKRIIVVDDGSPDDMSEVVARISGPILYVRQDNTGPGGATSAGIGLAESDYVATLDADDLWLPTKAELQLSRLDDEPELSAVFGHIAEFRGKPTNALLETAYEGWTRATMMMRTDVARGALPIFDPPEKLGDLIDWLAILREAGHRMIMMHDVLALRRLHAGSLTARARSELSKSYIAVARRSLLRRRERES